jgi:hypothetical protein
MIIHIFIHNVIILSVVLVVLGTAAIVGIFVYFCIIRRKSELPVFSVFRYTHVYFCMLVYIYVSVYVCMALYVCIHVYVSMYLCICVSIHMYVYIIVGIFVCICIIRRKSAFPVFAVCRYSVYMYVCMYIHIYICMYEYIYKYI